MARSNPASRHDSYIELEDLHNQIDSAIQRSHQILRDMGVDPEEYEHRGRRLHRSVVTSTPVTNLSDRNQSRHRRRSVSEGRQSESSVFARTTSDTNQTRESSRTRLSQTTDVKDQTSQQAGIRNMMNELVETFAQNPLEKCKVPPVNLPKFEIGGDWRCFLADFREMVKLADLRPTHQMAYFKQALPDEAKKMLYQTRVQTVQEGIDVLTELYDPKKDTWTILQEFEKISQKPGERLRVLASRIEEIASRFGETVTTKPAELNKLILNRFKHAIADEETRNHLLWDTTETVLEKLVKKAQQFEDARQLCRTKKARRTAGDESETDKLKRENRELKEKIESLSKTTVLKKKLTVTCWNCGEVGHFKRKCPYEKIGNGFTHRSKSNQAKSEQKSETENLNSQTQVEQGRPHWRK